MEQPKKCVMVGRSERLEIDDAARGGVFQPEFLALPFREPERRRRSDPAHLPVVNQAPHNAANEPARTRRDGGDQSAGPRIPHVD